MKCEVCGLEIKNKNTRHISKEHNMTVEEYYIKYLRENQREGFCYNCGENTHFISIFKGYSLLCADCGRRNRKGKISWNKGIPQREWMSEEGRKICSSTMIGRDPYTKGKPLCEWMDEKVNEKRKIKIRDTLKEKYDNGEIKSKSRFGENNPFYGKHHTEETREKIRKKLIGVHPSEETKNKIRIATKDTQFKSGEQHINWKNGASFKPYCPKFNNKFKEKIRDRFNRKCFLCLITEEEQMRKQQECGKRSFKLSVHHINYDKNCLCEETKCKFVPLCHSCHAKTNNNREYWESEILHKLEIYLQEN